MQEPTPPKRQNIPEMYDLSYSPDNSEKKKPKSQAAATTQMIACPFCRSRYRIRRSPQPQKFLCPQPKCKAHFYVMEVDNATKIVTSPQEVLAIQNAQKNKDIEDLHTVELDAEALAVFDEPVAPTLSITSLQSSLPTMNSNKSNAQDSKTTMSSPFLSRATSIIVQQAALQKNISQPTPQPIAQPKPAVQAAVQPKPAPQAAVQPKPAVQAAVQPKPAPQPIAQPKPAVQAAIQPKPAPQPIAQPKPVVQAAVQPKSHLQAAVQSKPAVQAAIPPKSAGQVIATAKAVSPQPIIQTSDTLQISLSLTEDESKQEAGSSSSLPIPQISLPLLDQSSSQEPDALQVPTSLQIPQISLSLMESSTKEEPASLQIPTSLQIPPSLLTTNALNASTSPQSLVTTQRRVAPSVPATLPNTPTSSLPTASASVATSPQNLVTTQRRVAPSTTTPTTPATPVATKSAAPVTVKPAAPTTTTAKPAAPVAAKPAAPAAPATTAKPAAPIVQQPSLEVPEQPAALIDFSAFLEEKEVPKADDFLHVTQTIPDSLESTMELGVEEQIAAKPTTGTKTTADTTAKKGEATSSTALPLENVEEKSFEELTKELTGIEAATILRYALSYNFMTQKDAYTLLDNYYKQKSPQYNIARLMLETGVITKSQYPTLYRFMNKDRNNQRIPPLELSPSETSLRKEIEQYVGIHDVKKTVCITCPKCKRQFTAKISLLRTNKFRCGHCDHVFFMRK